MKEEAAAPTASTSRAVLSDSEIVEEMVIQRSSRARTTALGKGKKVESEHESEESDEDGAEGLTRCVCAEDTEELGQALMIQCDTCKCWQHGPCVGLWGEKDCPDRYFCELCRPGWHGPGGILRKAHRKSGASSNPPPPKQARSPSVSASSSSRNKPRESADAALVAAFRAADMSVNPALAHEKLEKLLNESSGIDLIEGPLAHVLAQRRSTSVNSAGPRKSEEHAAEKAPKKRSTMNSRDAAYDDAIAMSILGPGSAAMRARLEQASGHGGDEDEEEEEDEDLKRHVQRTILEQSQRAERSRSRSSAPDDVDAGGKDSTSGDDYNAAPSPPAKKRRRAPPPPEKTNGHHVEPPLSDGGEDEEILEQHDTSREIAEDDRELADEEDGDISTLPTRTKHPNQYTYRAAKAAARTSRASPTKRQPAHAQNSARDHTSDHPPTSKQKAAASSSKEWNNHQHYDSNGWGMPEHLKHLAHVLPSTKPLPIAVPTYSSAAQYIDHNHEQHSPPPTASTAGSHSTLAAHDLAEAPLETHLEAPTKIRFPSKRMTMPEMRKRSKHVLEFVGRIQLELQEREKRNEAMKRAVEVGVSAHCSSAQSGLQPGVGSGMSASNGNGGGRAGRGRRWANSSRSSEDRVSPREETVVHGESVANGNGSLNRVAEVDGAQDNFKIIESFTQDVLLFQQRYFGTTD